MLQNTDLSYQHNLVRDELLQTFDRLLTINQFIGGEVVADFEAEFSSLIGKGFSVGVGNGTDALELAISSLRLKRGGKVILPANSFAATAEAVVNSGLTPLFADVDESMNLDPSSVERLISDEVAAIIFVPLYGNPTNADKIKELAHANLIFMIEDCAQAHFAELGETKAGDFGHISSFSFFPGKNFGALGDAGLVYSKNKNLIERVRLLANHGRKDRDSHMEIGRNSRLDSIQAGFLRVKLKIADSIVQGRRRNARRLISELSGLQEVTLPLFDDQAKPVFHQFVIRTDERDDLKDYLLSKGVEARVIYPKVIPLQEAFLRYQKGEWSQAEKFSSQILSIPVGEHLSSSEVDFISDSVKSFFLERRQK